MSRYSFLFFMLVTIKSYGEGKVIAVPHDNSSHLRISLLTCSTGLESWETFGHSSIRVIDSSKTGMQRDLVYNYGVLDYFDAEYKFEYNFFKGTISAFLDTNNYGRFINMFASEGRGVEELVLSLTDEQKDSIEKFLEWNLLTENKYYRYNLFFDNCTTRIRDIFPALFGKNFKFSQVLPVDSKRTFRDISFDAYCPQQHKYWIGLGLDIFYAGKIDQVLTNNYAMLDPVYLSEGLSGATLNGKKVCAEKITILKNTQPKPSGMNQPLVLFGVVALLTFLGLFIVRFHLLGSVMTYLVLCASGLMGCLILYAWFASGNVEWRNNFNLLWALPTNLIFPFLGSRAKGKYAVTAICFIVAVLIADLLKIQVIPLPEIAPFLLSLILIFIYYAKGGKLKLKGIAS